MKRTRIPLLMLLTFAGGCTSTQWRYLAYLFGPESRTATKDAAFPDLPGRRVAIVMYGDEKVEYEYPYARLRLAKMIAAELEGKVKKVKVVDPVAVMRFQEEHLNWDSMDKTELGRAFQADYVLMVSLIEYTTREPNSVGLSRGRVTAEASVYQSSLPEAQARVWNDSHISVVFPEDAPAGVISGEAQRILEETERRFVDSLVKKFYKHKEEVRES